MCFRRGMLTAIGGSATTLHEGSSFLQDDGVTNSPSASSLKAVYGVLFWI
ncbi:hypothetical protein L195_g060205 [Trifolium pratense]|uniref:Uncharacterized protein n=1 Tax=Trifolium pratense TaxID=57577 RepID=A0A2K3K2G3_TRIPR|nr:hypothetical protein L195_g060205 [Trifolium pratense]